MKPSLVKAIVDATAETERARRLPVNHEHCCNCCLARIIALEAMVDALTDAALNGTSADPNGKKL